MDVCDIAPEAGIKTTPRKKKCKKAKWLSEEALQVSVKRREVKSKREKKRDTHLNPDFQKTARIDKKAFLSDQYKEIEENNRMGKTRDLIKKIRDTKIMASGPITTWQMDGKTMKTVRNFIFGDSKSLQMVTTAMKLKDTCSLEEKL